MRCLSRCAPPRYSSSHCFRATWDTRLHARHTNTRTHAHTNRQTHKHTRAQPLRWCLACCTLLGIPNAAWVYVFVACVAHNGVLSMCVMRVSVCLSMCNVCLSESCDCLYMHPCFYLLECPFAGPPSLSRFLSLARACARSLFVSRCKRLCIGLTGCGQVARKADWNL